MFLKTNECVIDFKKTQMTSFQKKKVFIKHQL